MNGTNLKTSYSASPEVCDLDEDGNKDLVISDYSGYVYFFRNTGTDGNPTFTTHERLMAGNNYMKSNSSYARIDVVDWDEDGDLDILAGEFDAYVNLFLNTSNPSAVAGPPTATPSEFSLSQNYPNPFNSSSRIYYRLPQPTQVNLSIFDLSGQMVAVLVNEPKLAGVYMATWQAIGISSGIYLINLTTDRFSETRKCIFQK